MAGLLSDIVGMIDRAKQSAKANVGLLVSDPREYMASLNDQARAFNQASNLATQAKLNEMRGLLVTPEQAAAKEYVDKVNQDLAMGFAGTTNPIKGTWYKGMYPYDWTQEIRATKPNTPQWAQEVIYPGELIDPSNINRKTPFPSFSSLPDLEGIRGFFAKSPDVASKFAPAESGAVYPVNISAEKVFTIDAKGKKAGELQFGEKSKRFRNAVNSGKYDAIVIKNTADEGDIAIALQPAQIKSIFEK
jgi:hypothetical protein